MARTPLNRIVFGWTTPEHELQRLRAAFPDLEVELVTDEAFIDAIATADAAVAWSMTPDEWNAAAKLAWFQSIGAGVERVLLPGMRERGVLVTNTSGVHAANISEHVLAMMLAFARQLPQLLSAQSQAEWRDGPEVRGSVFELTGQSLLVVGFGEIGRMLARKAAALDMRVTAIRRQPGGDMPAGVEAVATLADLPALIGRADHVVICLPQTRETIGLFNAAMIGQMKRGAYLYNIGRGPIVDTQALVDALASGELGGAGLDVTEPEPLPADSPLWRDPRVIITSHTAGSTPYFWQRIMDVVIENVRRYRAGEEMKNLVSYDAGY